MDNEGFRDHEEERANAMQPWLDNQGDTMEKVFGSGWLVSQVLDYLLNNHPMPRYLIDQDSTREIIIATSLYQAPDGSLWRSLEDV